MHKVVEGFQLRRVADILQRDLDDGDGDDDVVVVLTLDI
jgi:hypothetical protein